jgi:hypothetical protein
MDNHKQERDAMLEALGCRDVAAALVKIRRLERDSRELAAMVTALGETNAVSAMVKLGRIVAEDYLWQAHLAADKARDRAGSDVFGSPDDRRVE